MLGKRRETLFILNMCECGNIQLSNPLSFCAARLSEAYNTVSEHFGKPGNDHNDAKVCPCVQCTNQFLM